MNRHDPHNIRIFSGGFRLPEINLILLQQINITDKMKQSTITRLLIIGGFLDQHRKVGLSPLSRRERRHVTSVSRHIKNLLDQFMDWQIPHTSKTRVLIIEAHKLLIRIFLLHRSQCRCRKRHTLITDADLCQFLLIQTDDL